MATKVKPCRLNVTGTPQVGDVPVYYDEDTFEWGAGGGGGGGNVKSFTLSSTSDLTTAQEAYDWYDDGNVAVIIYNDKEYLFDYATAGNAYWSVANEESYDTASATGIHRAALQLTLSSGSVTAITTLNISVNDLKVLRTDKNYGTPYSPQYDGSPATKKYVDDNKGDTIVYATQAEYTALLPGAESDGKHYFIYTPDNPTPRQPGVNTLAYWKLDGDLTDEMGSYDGTVTSNATVTFEPLPGDANVQCAKVTSSGWTYGISLPNALCNEILSAQTSFTFSVFIKTTESTTEMLYLDSSQAFICFSIRKQSGQNTGDFFFESGGQSGSFYTAGISANTWYNVVFTYDHTTRTKGFYINGVSAGTYSIGTDYTTSSTPTRAMLARINSNTLLSNMVLEKGVAWTQQDAEKYFNTFKSLYSLS